MRGAPRERGRSRSPGQPRARACGDTRGRGEGHTESPAAPPQAPVRRGPPRSGAVMGAPAAPQPGAPGDVLFSPLPLLAGASLRGSEERACPLLAGMPSALAPHLLTLTSLDAVSLIKQRVRWTSSTGCCSCRQAETTSVFPTTSPGAESEHFRPTPANK